MNSQRGRGRPAKSFSDAKKSKKYALINSLSENYPLHALLKAAKKKAISPLVQNLLNILIENENKSDDKLKQEIKKIVIEEKKVPADVTAAMILYNNLSGK